MAVFLNRPGFFISLVFPSAKNVLSLFLSCCDVPLRWYNKPPAFELTNLIWLNCYQGICQQKPWKLNSTENKYMAFFYILLSLYIVKNKLNL